MAGKAAEVALNVLGFLAGNIFGVLGLLPTPDLAPDPLAAGNSLVRIGIGLNSTSSTGTDGMGGTVPSIRIFNENQEPIGSAPSSTKNVIGQGQYVSITVKQNVTYQQPTYLAVAGGPDAICVSYIGQTWSDGTKLGWLGDVGSFCGAKWYYSNLYVSTTNGSLYKPRCTWIGGSNNDRFDVSGFMIHTPDFGKVGESNDFSVPDDLSVLCGTPHSEWYSRSFFQSASTSLKPFAFLHMLHVFGLISGAYGAVINQVQTMNFTLPDRRIFKESIVGSHDRQHNATLLCSNRASYGPDFVSFSEQVYCDMAVKKTWPLCSTSIQRDCYDWESHCLIEGRWRKRSMQYREIIEWSTT